MNWLVISLIQLVAGVAERLTRQSPKQVAAQAVRDAVTDAAQRDIDEAARKRLRELH